MQSWIVIMQVFQQRFPLLVIVDFVNEEMRDAMRIDIFHQFDKIVRGKPQVV